MLYIRRVGEVADGSVNADKLADGAVNLSTAKVTGELPTSKIENGAINEDKLANLSISTGKLKDNVVTLAKAQQALKIHHFTGDETEVSVLGTTETGVKQFKIVKATSQTSGIQPQKLHVNAEIKTTNVSAQGTLKVYIDAEGTPRITINTTSTSYEMVEGNADISDLANGAHDVIIKLVNADGAETTYNDLIEIFVEK
jgi:hypothetical protein